jgi:hypothetical protein
MALGNAKILYGCEKFKFYGSGFQTCLKARTDMQLDIVIAYNELDARFAAVLVCSFNEATKVLRKEVAVCPVTAARTIVHGLHKDSGLLLSTSCFYVACTSAY